MSSSWMVSPTPPILCTLALSSSNSSSCCLKQLIGKAQAISTNSSVFGWLQFTEAIDSSLIWNIPYSKHKRNQEKHKKKPRNLGHLNIKTQDLFLMASNIPFHDMNPSSAHWATKKHKGCNHRCIKITILDILNIPYNWIWFNWGTCVGLPMGWAWIASVLDLSGRASKINFLKPGSSLWTTISFIKNIGQPFKFQQP